MSERFRVPHTILYFILGKKTRADLRKLAGMMDIRKGRNKEDTIRNLIREGGDRFFATIEYHKEPT